MPHSKLTEGMREGDLADLVLPLISVDEYESKVASDDEALVFGFYVHDEAAANDLNRFLQKSAAPILDTDVSPAPDQHGYFMVFVEMNKDARLPENVEDILAEIKSLVDIDSWQMRVRDLDDLIPFSQKNLMAALKKSAKHVTEQAILAYLQPSALDMAMIDEDLLILQGSGERFVFDVVGYDQFDELLTQHKLTEAGYSYSLRSVARTNRIARILGEGWLVLELDGYTMLHQIDTGHALLLTH
jgi:hypothetical protein